MYLLKPFIKLLKLTKRGGVLATKLVKMTGKYPESIHPKHLVSLESPWYLKYIKKSDNILDVGCNNGSHTIECSRICKFITGFDYNENSLIIARNRIKRKHIKNIKIIKHNAEEKFPFNKNQFDKILFLDILEHLNKRDFVLSEVRRVLKPDGLLFLSIPNVDTSWKGLQKKAGLNPYSDSDHKIEYTKDSIRGELESNVFKIIKMGTIVYDTPLAGIIDFIGGLSLPIYKKLSLWKMKMVKLRPKETTGFRIIAK